MRTYKMSIVFLSILIVRLIPVLVAFTYNRLSLPLKSALFMRISFSLKLISFYVKANAPPLRIPL